MSESEPTERRSGLKRSLGLIAVISLGLNGVIGQGIFLVPGKAADLMGPSALVALGMGALLCFCIALCFAEVGSRFRGTGGAYLYAREAFGEFIGFEVTGAVLVETDSKGAPRPLPPLHVGAAHPPHRPQAVQDARAARHSAGRGQAPGHR